MWILSRVLKMDEVLLSDLVARTKRLGFDTDVLIYVNYDQIDG